MRILKVIFLCIAIVGLTAPAWSQPPNPARPAAAPVLGYLYPRTGVFMPMQASTGTGDVPEAVTPTTGKFVVNFTITVKSAIPSSVPIICAVGAVADEFSSSTVRAFTEEANLTATRSTGMAKCTVTIPYSWGLASPGTDTVSLSYTIIADGSGVSRTSSQSIVTLHGAPANGTTTTENVKATF